MVLNKLRSYTNRKKNNPKHCAYPEVNISMIRQQLVRARFVLVIQCIQVELSLLEPSTKSTSIAAKSSNKKIGKETFQPSIANMEIANVALTDLTERSFRSGNFMDLKSLRKRSPQTEQLLLKAKKSLAPQQLVIRSQSICSLFPLRKTRTKA